MKKNYVISIFIICLFSTFLHASVAYGHKVYFFAYVDGKKVVAEGYFLDGKKAIGSTVDVIDNKTGEKLLAGKTNRKGQFSFSPPRKVDLKLVLDAGMGHKTEYLLTSDQFEEIVENISTVSKTDKNTTPNEKESVTPEVVRQTIDPKILKRIIDQSLDEKLRPIIIEMAKSEGGSSPSKNIFAGLGYIFGFMGLAMYFKKK